MIPVRKVEFDTLSSPLFKQKPEERVFLYFGNEKFVEVPKAAEIFQVPFFVYSDVDSRIFELIESIQNQNPKLVFKEAVISVGTGRFHGNFGVHFVVNE